MLEAVHFCMMMRGVEKQASRTTTTAWLGSFERDASLRQEFLASIRGAAPAPRASFPLPEAEPRFGVLAPRAPREAGHYPRPLATAPLHPGGEHELETC